MKSVDVEFLANCADDKRGEFKQIPAVRAMRLARGGYVRIIEDEIAEAPESAMRPKAKPRGPLTETRG